MDNEIEEILDEIEEFFLTASDAERAYRKLSPDERAQYWRLSEESTRQNLRSCSVGAGLDNFE